MRNASDTEELKLGKGVAFVKRQLRRLRQEDDTWEVDFRALPKAIRQGSTHYVGMVIVPPHGDLLAMSEIEKSPTVNDLATLLADAMKRPLVHGQHRPRLIHLRGNRQWKPLFPALKELGIEVAVIPRLRSVSEAFGELLTPVNEVRPVGKVKLTKEQATVRATGD